MNKTRITQIAVILGGVALLSIIYFNGKNSSTALTNSKTEATNSPASAKKNGVTPFDFSKYEQDEFTKISDESLKKEYQKLISTKEDTASIRALALLFDKLERPILSAFFYKQRATSKKNDANDWHLTGKRMFESQSFVEEPQIQAYFGQEALNALIKANELNPLNLEAKADLAAVYIESAQETMKGVGLLREIIQVDSNHRQALLYLGFLSMQSKQFDKAIVRFQKLTDTYPLVPEFHRYLADAYLAIGNKDKGKKSLEKYKSLLRDPKMIAEANKLILSVQ